MKTNHYGDESVGPRNGSGYIPEDYTQGTERGGCQDASGARYDDAGYTPGANPAYDAGYQAGYAAAQRDGYATKPAGEENYGASPEYGGSR